VHMTLLGKEGLREMAGQNLSKAHFALGELEKIPGVRRAFEGPFFNEFTVSLPRSVDSVNQLLLREKIVGPLALDAFYPELPNHALVCVTETTTRAQIENLSSELRMAMALASETR
jgi:glycine dehydrogenase subunit 1